MDVHRPNVTTRSAAVNVAQALDEQPRAADERSVVASNSSSSSEPFQDFNPEVRDDQNADDIAALFRTNSPRASMHEGSIGRQPSLGARTHVWAKLSG